MRTSNRISLDVFGLRNHSLANHSSSAAAHCCTFCTTSSAISGLSTSIPTTSPLKDPQTKDFQLKFSSPSHHHLDPLPPASALLNHRNVTSTSITHPKLHPSMNNGSRYLPTHSPTHPNPFIIFNEFEAGTSRSAQNQPTIVGSCAMVEIK